jgi:hypothetical protein
MKLSTRLNDKEIFTFIGKNFVEVTFFYSTSLRFGLRDGSLDKKPKINKELKNETVTYTRIFKVSIEISPKSFYS